MVINSCILIISKVNYNVMTHDEVVENVEEIGAQNQNLRAEGQMLVKTLVKKKRILSFPTPEFINSGTTNSLIMAIQDMQGFPIASEAIISLSPAAKNTLEEMNKVI